MAESNPKAEYYKLVDGRGETDFLCNHGQQFDDDPAVSDALKWAHHARWMAMAPSWTPSSRETPPTWPAGAYGDHEFPLPPELAPRSAAFKKDIPYEMPHYDFAYGYGHLTSNAVYNSNVNVVSEAWRQAIESVEPGVHEFFPFELRFRNGVVKDHFMFRNRVALDLIDLKKSDATEYKDADGTTKRHIHSDAAFFFVKRSFVSGQHWMEYGPLSGVVFVSRELAVKLQGVLPRKCNFMAVRVSDAE